MGETETFAEVPGLTLFRDVVSAEFHDELCALVERLLIAGRKGQLEGKTFCAVEKESRSLRQQSRDLIQFGVYTHSNQVEWAAKVLPSADRPSPAYCLISALAGGAHPTSSRTPH
jgi:hypothetical protein